MSDKKTVLVIDDEPDILDLFEIFLYGEFDIVTASNGFDALSLLKKELVDCILVDIMMPVMDGIQFFTRCRNMPDTAHIPVIVVTSFNSATIQEKSLRDIGFYDVLLKPLSQTILLDTVRGAVNGN
ncbi:MAG: response regulator [Fibrobacterota bacterium]